MSMDAQPATSGAIYTQRSTCRACGASQFESVLDLGVQYLPRFVPDVDTTLPKAPLHLVRCGNCNMVQLEHTVEPDLLYRHFWYRTGINATMREAMEDIVTHVAKFRGGLRKHQKRTGEQWWLDIGANDGYLLSRVPDEYHKAACEPALNFKAELEEQADKVILDYFTKAATKGQLFDVITSAAMFYDLDNPHPFLADIHDSLDDGGIWVNQLNDAPTMLKSNAFDSICHEHVAYYDLHVLRDLYEAHDLKIVSISYNQVNGGSVRLIAMRAEDAPDYYTMADQPRAGGIECRAFGARIGRWKETMTELIVQSDAPWWGYGASTKGSTLLQYLGEPVFNHCRKFQGIADRNPRKHGLLMAGCWLPIFDEAAFRRAAPKFALVLPWAFRDEFVARELATRDAGTRLVFPLPNPEIVL